MSKSTSASRRAGYAIGALVNAILLYLINIWPGWRIVPFLTDSMSQVIGLVNLSLIVGIVVNVLTLIVDRVRVKAVGDLVTLGIGIAVLVRFWQVFPFNFPPGPIDWELVARVVLVVSIIGSVIAVIVQCVVLIRGSRGRGPVRGDE
jgi:hypothetical protein